MPDPVTVNTTDERTIGVTDARDLTPADLITLGRALLEAGEDGYRGFSLTTRSAGSQYDPIDIGFNLKLRRTPS